MNAQFNVKSAMLPMVILLIILMAVAAAIVWGSSGRNEKFRYIFGLLTVLFALIIFVMRWLQVKRQAVTIENGMLIYRYGVVEATELEVKLSKLAAITVRRTFLNRLCGGAGIGLSGYGIRAHMMITSGDANVLFINDVDNYKDLIVLIKSKMVDTPT